MALKTPKPIPTKVKGVRCQQRQPHQTKLPIATGEVVVIRKQDKEQDNKIHITQHDKFEDQTNVFISENAASLLRHNGLDRD